MTTIKSHTDFEQSKKLAEILRTESADMYYHYTTGVKSYHEDVPKYVQVFNHFVFFHYDIPCWSLTALLGVLPSVSLESSDDHHYRVQDCLSGKTTQASGFQWKYKTEDTYPTKIAAYVRNTNQSLCCSRPIKQLKDGVAVANYGSIKEASEKTGFDYSGIKKCLNGTYKQTLGFTWEYDDCPNYKKKVIHYGTK